MIECLLRINSIDTLYTIISIGSHMAKLRFRHMFCITRISGVPTHNENKSIALPFAVANALDAADALPSPERREQLIVA